MASDLAGGVIFEYQFLAHAVKVSAVDVDSGTEVSIVGPRNAPQSELEKTARAKLDWVMNKAREPRPGRIV